MQEYLIALRKSCSELTSLRLQQFTVGNVQRLPEFLACQEVKHEHSAAQLDAFGDMAVGAVTAACHAALEHLEAHLSHLHPDQVCKLHFTCGCTLNRKKKLVVETGSKPHSRALSMLCLHPIAQCIRDVDWQALRTWDCHGSVTCHISSIEAMSTSDSISGSSSTEATFTCL